MNFFLLLSFFMSIGSAIIINATDGVYYSQKEAMPVLICQIQERDLTLDWSVKGLPVSSVHFKVLSSDSEIRLEFLYVDETMLGDLYKCSVFDSRKRMIGSKKVSLNAKPQVSIKMKENSIYAWEGSQVQMTCSYWGSPLPKARWTSMVTRIEMTKSVQVSRYKSTITLTLNNITRLLSGVFICQALNSVGNTHVKTNLRVRGQISWIVPLLIILSELFIALSILTLNSCYKAKPQELKD